MGFLKDVIDTARAVKAARKAGAEGNLAIVHEDELLDSRHWLAQRDWENQLMQSCIRDIMDYKTPCSYCEENAECKREQHGKRGCREWWLRFLTEEEMEACAQRAAVKEEEGKNGAISAKTQKDAKDKDEKQR